MRRTLSRTTEAKAAAAAVGNVPAGKAAGDMWLGQPNPFSTAHGSGLMDAARRTSVSVLRGRDRYFAPRGRAGLMSTVPRFAPFPFAAPLAISGLNFSPSVAVGSSKT